MREFMLTFAAILSLETVRAFTLVTTNNVCALSAIFAWLVDITNVTVCREMLKFSVEWEALCIKHSEKHKLTDSLFEPSVKFSFLSPIFILLNLP